MVVLSFWMESLGFNVRCCMIFIVKLFVAYSLLVHRSTTSKYGYVDSPNGDSQTSTVGGCLLEVVIGCRVEIGDWSQTRSQANIKVEDDKV